MSEQTPRGWRIACMRAKLALWRNSDKEPTDAQLAEGLATNPQEVAEAKEP